MEEMSKNRNYKVLGAVLFLMVCVSSAVAFFHAPLAFLPAIIIAHKIPFIKSVIA
ncbi:MAG: hypothetical protein ACLFQJ_03625 [Campylobacterales bacterium]